MKTINTSPTNRGLRYVARDPEDTRTALLYWVGTALPARAANFAEVTQRLSPLMQVVFPDERPGVFVNPLAVRQVIRNGSLERLIFVDGSWLDVWSGGSCTDLCSLHASRRHRCR
jgi:hypothetical protein